jgi:hypothetical protein
MVTMQTTSGGGGLWWGLNDVALEGKCKHSEVT